MSPFDKGDEHEAQGLEIQFIFKIFKNFHLPIYHLNQKNHSKITVQTRGRVLSSTKYTIDTYGIPALVSSPISQVRLFE